MSEISSHFQKPRFFWLRPWPWLESRLNIRLKICLVLYITFAVPFIGIPLQTHVASTDGNICSSGVVTTCLLSISSRSELVSSVTRWEGQISVVSPEQLEYSPARSRCEPASSENLQHRLSAPTRGLIGLRELSQRQSEQPGSSPATVAAIQCRSFPVNAHRGSDSLSCACQEIPGMLLPMGTYQPKTLMPSECSQMHHEADHHPRQWQQC